MQLGCAGHWEAHAPANGASFPLLLLGPEQRHSWAPWLWAPPRRAKVPSRSFTSPLILFLVSCHQQMMTVHFFFPIWVLFVASCLAAVAGTSRAVSIDTCENNLPVLCLLPRSCDLYSSFCLRCNVSCSIDLQTLYQPRIPGINSTSPWCVIFSVHYWIRFAHILLRILASLFIRDIGLYFFFLSSIFIWFWN